MRSVAGPPLKRRTCTRHSASFDEVLESAIRDGAQSKLRGAHQLTHKPGFFAQTPSYVTYLVL